MGPVPFYHMLSRVGSSSVIGFGFSKTLEQNYELLDNLELLNMLEKPMLVGASRKSMIYKLLNNSPAEALNGTSVINTIALQKGAKILQNAYICIFCGFLCPIHLVFYTNFSYLLIDIIYSNFKVVLE